MNSKAALANWLDGTLDSEIDSLVTEATSEPLAEIANELVVHSLLWQRFESADASRSRVDAALNAFDRNWLETSPRRDAPRLIARRVAARRVAIAASCTAGLALILGLVFLLTPPSASAAMDRVIRALDSTGVRVYAGRISRTRFGGASREFRLYSSSAEKFAAVFENQRLTPVVIGADGNRRWTVFGERVWHSDDENAAAWPIRDRLLSRVTLRNLNLNELLNRVPRRYHVALLPPEPLPGDPAIACRPIEATLRGSGQVAGESLPSRIRIWSHPQTGVVSQLHVIRGSSADDRSSRDWQGNAESRIENRIELALIDETTVADEFFTPAFHLSNPKPK